MAPFDKLILLINWRFYKETEISHISLSTCMCVLYFFKFSYQVPPYNFSLCVCGNLIDFCQIMQLCNDGIFYGLGKSWMRWDTERAAGRNKKASNWLPYPLNLWVALQACDCQGNSPEAKENDEIPFRSRKHAWLVRRKRCHGRWNVRSRTRRGGRRFLSPYWQRGVKDVTSKRQCISIESIMKFILAFQWTLRTVFILCLYNFIFITVFQMKGCSYELVYLSCQGEKVIFNSHMSMR